MIKKARVIGIEQVNMYCDKCGKRMERENVVIATNPPIFTYSCECGNKAESNRAYPHQIFYFDEENAEVVDEI